MSREGFGEKVTRPLNEFADHEGVVVWQDPNKRRAVEPRAYLGGLQVTPDNEVEIHIGN